MASPPELATQQQPIPLVGQVLLDDLRSASGNDRDSIKAAVVALLYKRVEPYKNADPKYKKTPLRYRVTTKHSDDSNAAFVVMILQDLDKILGERDRDECEILITKPGFQELTDKSLIPAYQGFGFGVTHQQDRPIVQANMTSLTSGSMMACNPLFDVLREELKKKSHKRTEIRNTISQIILAFLKTGNFSTGILSGTNDSSNAHTVVDDIDFRLVAFWTSKIVKLDDDVMNCIKKYLFPLKPKV